MHIVLNLLDQIYGLHYVLGENLKDLMFLKKQGQSYLIPFQKIYDSCQEISVQEKVPREIEHTINH